MIKETDPESGQPLVQPSSSSAPSASSSSSSTSSDGGNTFDQLRAWFLSETKLFGQKFPTWSILLLFVLAFLLMGQAGLIFAVLVVGIGYHLVGAPAGASPSAGSAPTRGRTNIRGIGDLPKPPPSC